MLFVIEQRLFMVKIELVYIAENQTTFYLEMDLPDGSTVSAALNQSKIYEIHPETYTLKIGIYSKIVSKETLLRNGDRIELYRPLHADPKEKRRLVAKIKKKGTARTSS